MGINLGQSLNPEGAFADRNVSRKKPWSSMAVGPLSSSSFTNLSMAYSMSSSMQFFCVYSTCCSGLKLILKISTMPKLQSNYQVVYPTSRFQFFRNRKKCQDLNLLQASTLQFLTRLFFDMPGLRASTQVGDHLHSTTWSSSEAELQQEQYQNKHTVNKQHITQHEVPIRALNHVKNHTFF